MTVSKAPFHLVRRRPLVFNVQEEQLYTWAAVGLPVSSQLWELYGGQTSKEQSFRSTLCLSLSKVQRTQNSQVGNRHLRFNNDK